MQVVPLCRSPPSISQPQDALVEQQRLRQWNLAQEPRRKSQSCQLPSSEPRAPAQTTSSDQERALIREILLDSDKFQNQMHLRLLQLQAYRFDQ